MATNLSALRWDCWCSPRASTSLPVPLSPNNNTVTLALATFSMVRQMPSIPGSRVIRPDRPSGSAMARKRLFSACSACILNARSTLMLSTSGSKGLARKSYAPMATAFRAFVWSFCPVRTITLVSGSATSISSSSLNPSVTESASGGNPRSIVTTAGAWRRNWISALSRSWASSASKRSSDHLICFCNAGSSSTISRDCSFSVLMQFPAGASPRNGKFPQVAAAA